MSHNSDSHCRRHLRSRRHRRLRLPKTSQQRLRWRHPKGFPPCERWVGLARNALLFLGKCHYCKTTPRAFDRQKPFSLPLEFLFSRRRDEWIHLRWRRTARPTPFAFFPFTLLPFRETARGEEGSPLLHFQSVQSGPLREKQRLHFSVENCLSIIPITGCSCNFTVCKDLCRYEIDHLEHKQTNT